MPAIPMSAKETLDRHFLEVRCKLLEIAGTLDRIDRADGSQAAANDPRRQKIAQAIEMLQSREGDRAERLQLLFSREYDPAWIKDFEGAGVFENGR